MEILNKIFKLKENNTTVSTEIFAGITTFMTIAYILIVNPSILGDLRGAGMDSGGVFTATVIATMIGTLTVAFLANYPFVLVPGMGINAYFSYVIAKTYGWEIALCAVLVEGVIFIIISFVNVREAIFNAIPRNLKLAISVGVGLFIAFIGFKNAGIVVPSPDTFITAGDLTEVAPCLSIIGLICICVMSYYKVKGALLWGILITYIMGIGCELIGWYVPSDVNPSLIPTSIVSLPPSLSDVNIFTAIGNINFEKIKIFDFIMVLISLLFVDMFDTIATIVGVSEKSGFLDKKGGLPRLKQALLSDAIATVFGAIVGTSTTTTAVESSAGTAQGGKTGLTAVVIAGLFFLALFFSPVLTAIPSFATAPALIIVGLLMVDSIVKIDFSDYTESIPCFLAIIVMPFTYSISHGLMFGILTYVVLKVLTGKRKDVNIVLCVIAFIFFLRLFGFI